MQSLLLYYSQLFGPYHLYCQSLFQASQSRIRGWKEI